MRQLPAPPGELALDVLPRRGLGAGGGLLQRELAVHVGDEFGQSDGLHGGEHGIEVAEGACLIERAGLQHAIEAGLGAGMQLLAWDVEEDALHRNTGERGEVLPLPLPVQQRAAGGLDDLERAGEPLAVAGEQLRRKDGIAPRQLGVEIAIEAAPPGADLLRDVRDRGEALLEGAEIEARSAGDDGKEALPPGRFDLAPGLGEPEGDGVRLFGADVAIEPVRRAGLILGRGPGREDAERLIDLQRIGIDDDAAKRRGLLQRQGGLAAGGGACNKQRAFLVTGGHMDSVLVLIAAPGSGAISANVIEMLRDFGGGQPRWLAEAEALEVPDFEARAGFVEALSVLPLDVNLVPVENRRKRLLIADMDSTMIEQECIDELGMMAGIGEPIKAITARAMRGELDFEGALKERVKLLKDLDVRVIDTILRERISYMPGGQTLIATMKAGGAHTALVSGGFTPFTARVAADLGFDENQANELIVADGVLTGEVGHPILGQQAKLDALRRIASRLGIATADALAVGDGANDLAMLREAGMGVALHAKPQVQAEARFRVNHGDLTALLYLQGYAKAEFAG